MTAEDGETVLYYAVTITRAEPDTTAPVLSETGVSNITGTTATLNFTSDEAGTYYSVYAAEDEARISIPLKPRAMR